MINRQFAIFVMGGVISALIDIGSMQILIVLGADKILATSIGFFSGLLFNYIFHARMTFKSKSSILVLCRFLIVVSANYLITIILVYCSYSIFHQNALLGKIVSLPIVAINGFLLSKYWVFK
ncbi:GtrA family protein [Collimonas arenae]|uniref:GtrA family protein n=1 Tax=Collimonas arenae TaxID=279058 RepID=UPI00077827CF|nr:GtrA family protein [Collimonas arenae]